MDKKGSKIDACGTEQYLAPQTTFFTDLLK